MGRKARLYFRCGVRAAPIFTSPTSRERDEAHLSAQRAPAQAPARFPRADVDARGARDPEAPPCQGPQAALGVTPVQRRYRLSRSRDFDAVYRHGRSVSTRFLVLYWFAHEEEGGDARLGLAVPKGVGTAVARNKIKRRLREAWRSALDEIPAGRDYVLIVRPGLPDAAEARGADWLRERVLEVLGKAQA